MLIKKCLYFKIIDDDDDEKWIVYNTPRLGGGGGILKMSIYLMNNLKQIIYI